MKIGIRITPRPDLADPQSETVARTLTKRGFATVKSCAVGRWMEVDVEESNQEKALSAVRSMCEDLLVNPILEDVRLEVLES